VPSGTVCMSPRGAPQRMRSYCWDPHTCCDSEVMGGSHDRGLLMTASAMLTAEGPRTLHHEPCIIRREGARHMRARGRGAVALFLLAPMVVTAFGFGGVLARRAPVIVRIRDTCSSIVKQALSRRRESGEPTPVWKMKISGRQEYYLAQEQAWERDLDAACPSVEAAAAGCAVNCAHCSKGLEGAAVTCGGCLAASATYCSEACHQEAWEMHKFSCSATVQVKRSQTGDGLGVFARKCFSVGDELIRERPLVVLADQEFEARGESYLNERVAKLPPVRRSVVLQLADVYADPPSAVGVIQTNTLPVDDQNFGGLFALGCRINHSCRPNGELFSDCPRCRCTPPHPFPPSSPPSLSCRHCHMSPAMEGLSNRR